MGPCKFQIREAFECSPAVRGLGEMSSMCMVRFRSNRRVVKDRSIPGAVSARPRALTERNGSGPGPSLGRSEGGSARVARGPPRARARCSAHAPAPAPARARS
eukprot:scaffold897_cov402-Prasinococcus_capsulatus_cf.AAC.31